MKSDRSWILPTFAAAVLGLGSAEVIAQMPATPTDMNFGFDDLMTLLIQPRHVKLYYAGRQKNWELAAAEMRDLRFGLTQIAQRFPKYLNNGVDAATNQILEPKLAAVDEAIAAADAKRFLATYSDLTAACNACHAYMEHPYIVVKVPSAEGKFAFPDQDFHSRQ